MESMDKGTVTEVPEALTEWEEIHSPFPLTRHAPPQQPPSPSVVTANNEDCSSVFPPIRHEGLPIPLPPPLQPNSPSSSSSSSSPTPPPPPSPSPPPSSSSSTNSKGDEEARRRPRLLDSRLVAVKEIGKQLRLRLGILSAEAVRAASKICNYKLISGRFWSIASVAGVVAVVFLSLLYARIRSPWNRRVLLLRRRRDDKEQLLLLLRQKDEKISQLLLQVAQMNEALSARRRVPVIRVV